MQLSEITIDAETRSHHDSGKRSGHLEVRCPGCRTPIEVAVDTQLTDLTCSSCGSHFSLVDQRKATRMAPSLSRLGRFELIERLGVGGFGSVWKARDKELDRTVALKIPRAGGMTGEEQEKFFREARAAAQLKHPAIVSVHEVGRDGDSIYIVSDYVRGVTLGDWLTGQQLTNREAAELCAKIADALHHAHEHGVVHRDLKPANIMIDGDAQPHLMDFGLARREVGEVTVTIDGQVLGTPAYMSPEQAQGEAHTADRRSDVYSLGVILFQLLTGELPFRGNARMLIHQVIHEIAPTPRKFNANIPKDLETIALKCLDKEPSRRYQTTQEFGDELRRFLAGETIRARPISRFHRGWRLAKRNPVAAVLAFITLVAVIAVSAGAVTFAVMQKNLADERTRLARDKEVARLDAETKLYQALLDRAKGLRMVRAPGYRTEVWKSLHTATKMEVPQKNVDEIRNEVLACLGDPIGLTPVEAPTVTRSQATSIPEHFRSIVRKVSASRFAVSFDGRLLAVSDGESPVRVTLFKVDGTEISSQKAPLSSIADLKFSHDDRQLIAGCGQGVVVWSVPELGFSSISHGETVFEVAVQPQGSLFATMGGGSRVELVSLKTNRLIASFTAPAEVGAIEFSKDGRLLLGISKDRQKVIAGWFVRDSPEKVHLTGHTQAVTGVAFSPAGGILASTSHDTTVRIWDTETGTLRHTCRGHSAGVQDMALSPDGKLLVTGDVGGEVRVWAPLTGALLTSARHGGWCWRIEFNPSGRFFVTGGEGGAICWEVNTNDGRVELIPFSGAFSPRTFDLAIHPAGKSFILTDIQRRPVKAFYVDLTKSDGPQALELPLAYGFDQIKFDRLGKHLFFTTLEKTIATWDVARNQIDRQTPDQFSPSSGAHCITPDDRWAAIIGPSGKQITIYDLQENRPLFVLPPEPHPIWNVGWSPDGIRIAVARPDGVLAIWNLNEIRERLAEFGLHVPSTAVKSGELPQAPQLSQIQFHQIKDTQRPLWQRFQQFMQVSKLLESAHAAYLNKRPEEAIKQNEEAVELFNRLVQEVPEVSEYSQDLVKSTNDLAWMLATSERQELRNGKKAVELATKAVGLTLQNDPSSMNTLAAAYAETGNFDAAVKWSEKSLELLRDRGAPAIRERYSQALINYKAKQPMRQETPHAKADTPNDGQPAKTEPIDARSEATLINRGDLPGQK